MLHLQAPLSRALGYGAHCSVIAVGAAVKRCAPYSVPKGELGNAPAKQPRRRHSLSPISASCVAT
jgi:hypothetical protein